MTNNRLQALADEAEDYADSIVDKGGDFHPAYTQKLAQLMLEECMEIARRRLIPSPLWENDEHLKSHNQALWCAISDMKELLV